MDKRKAAYIVQYYAHLMTEQERKAHRHLAATLKIARGHSDAIAQEEAKTSRSPIREWLSDDPEVLQLASQGWQAFEQHVAERILRIHGDAVVFNCCPRCGAVAKTPKAQQCAVCRHDWHPQVGNK
jgi:hypothetical protein